MAFLVLVRHGQSQWNLENRFTGLADPALTEHGLAEAKKVCNILENYKFNIGYTSELQRAKDTLKLIAPYVAVKANKALNERDYGELQGLNKIEARSKFGNEYIDNIRRGFSYRPINGESLEDTYNRAIPYFEENVLKDIIEDKNVLLVAHGNSIRAIIMYLDKLSQEQVAKLEVGNCIPVIYEMDKLSIKTKKILDFL